jgi:hypothetical protein
MKEPLKFSGVVKTLEYLLPLAAAAALAYYFGGARLAGGVAAGGAIGYMNFELLTRGVEAFIGASGVRGVVVFLSFLRLAVMFALITALVYFHLVSVFGLLIGFTVVFTVNIFEGLKLARGMQHIQSNNAATNSSGTKSL